MNSLTDISNQNEEQQAKVQRLPISGGGSSSSRRRARRRRRRRRLRLDVDGVLHDGLPGGGAGVDGVRLHVPARHPELAAAADDAHLADVGEHLVPAQDREAAALVLAGGEHEVHHHQEPERALVCERVGALGAPDLGPRGAGRPRGQRVVDGHHRAEEGGGGVGRRRLRDADRRRARPAHDVVEVDLERREPAVVRRALVEPDPLQVLRLLLARGAGVRLVGALLLVVVVILVALVLLVAGGVVGSDV